VDLALEDKHDLSTIEMSERTGVATQTPQVVENWPSWWKVGLTPGEINDAGGQSGMETSDGLLES